MKKLSEKFYSSPYHVQRKFKRLKGISPLEYTQDVRINKAVELLIHSRIKTTAISLQAGFSNNASFVTLFKKRKGLTPSEFRKKHQL